MWVHLRVDALALRPVRDPGLYRTGAYASTAFTDEQRGFVGIRKLTSGFAPPFECRESLAPDGHNSIFVAFARYVHGGVVAIDVA